MSDAADIRIYLIKKKKGRLYKSDAIVPLILEKEGIQGLRFSHGTSGIPELICTAGISADNAAQSSEARSCGSAPLPGLYQISISDTKNFWCAALSGNGAVGIDIEERNRSLTPRLVKRFHSLEQKYLSGLEPASSEWEEEVLTIWTRKEAYSKFCGSGLSIGLAHFSVVDEDLFFTETIRCGQRPQACVRSVALNSTLFCALCTEAYMPRCSPSISIAAFDYDGQPPMSPLAAASEILAARNISSAELKKKLEYKGYTRQEADAAAEEMRARGYLDDEGYALRQMTLEAKKGRSEQLIRRNLTAKGLKAEDVDSALQQLSEAGESEFDRAMAAAQKVFPLPSADCCLTDERNCFRKGRCDPDEKHCPQDPGYLDEKHCPQDPGYLDEKPSPEDPRYPDEKQLAKIGRKLASLGYRSGIIYKVLDQYRK